MLRPLLLTAALALTTAVPAATPASAAAGDGDGDGVKVRNGCVRSVPDPGSEQKVRICYTIFKPAGASRRHQVPFLMHSHGWGGSRTTDPSAFRQWLDAGYGVLSFDQRGFGESGGHAQVENPRYEGKDNLRLIRRVARLPWVRKDGPGDPRLGAIGGSYGGGYQFLGAFKELQRRGKPVYDAIAPEITWHDLNESLAPNGVVRTEWAYALSAAALPTDALPPKVYQALVEGSATGQWPDGTGPSGVDMEKFFRRNGPSWHERQGRRLRIPVLFGQGTTDTLFNLEQGLRNWRRALAPQARRDSIFLAYNGGHALPAAVPLGVQVTSDPCSRKLAGGDFDDLALRFFDEQLKGRDRGLTGYGRFHLATPDSTCTSVRSAGADTRREVGEVVSPEAAGAPLHFPIAEGPIRIAGSSRLLGRLTATAPENRAFFGLAVGSTPGDARLVQNNVYPLNEPGPVTGRRLRLELPAVAVDVPAGQTLYLAVSAVSDTFAGTQTRTPGVVVVEDASVRLPVVGR
ncbi:CocE/NonD family hydrolase [Nocardioides coralli]|uniref:CocE/NonD family hydrolase n=1 Tax=Nocardioides coralli TaxID=2872154 RepID=UPI001CA39D69|nr:CocE/NonD family hydrolase [Nocardioides coralli]QZY29754.1 peptidase S15 [Nocardioides coralli]